MQSPRICARIFGVCVCVCVCIATTPGDRASIVFAIISLSIRWNDLIIRAAMRARANSIERDWLFGEKCAIIVFSVRLWDIFKCKIAERERERERERAKKIWKRNCTKCSNVTEQNCRENTRGILWIIQSTEKCFATFIAKLQRKCVKNFIICSKYKTFYNIWCKVTERVCNTKRML